MNIIFKDYINLNENESLEILNLRNKEYIRLNMQNIEPIEEKSHFKWIESLKNDHNKEYFAIIYENSIQGSISWVQDEQNSIVWGIYCNKEINPIISSLSAYILIDYLFNNKEFNTINSYVKVENKIALQFNKSLGFKQNGEDSSFNYLNLTKDSWVKNESRTIRTLKRYLDKINYKFQ